MFCGKFFDKFGSLSLNSAGHYLNTQHNSALKGGGGKLYAPTLLKVAGQGPPVPTSLLTEEHVYIDTDRQTDRLDVKLSG